MEQEQRNDDPFDLKRFVSAQEKDYSLALSEIKAGEKNSHWMWFIFPQFKGLGQSPKSIKYSIKSIEEAKAYLQHPILGKRLKDCAEALLDVKRKSAFEIFGHTDKLKLKSSMTLFEQVSEKNTVFSSVLEKYFNGKRDVSTLDLLKNNLTE
jgi:uncharacterized protein (DUF1810 family)